MKSFVFVLGLFFTLTLLSQENLLYLELGGAGPIGSINYERQVAKTPILNLRGGLGYISTWDYEGVTLPAGLYFLNHLKNSNYLELGMSYTFLFDNDGHDTKGFFLPSIGYRKYFSRNKGFLKVTFNPVFFNDDPIEIIPWGGISYGFRI